MQRGDLGEYCRDEAHLAVTTPLALIADAPDSEACLVSLSGELDIADVPALREWIRRAGEDGARNVVVDLNAVRFLAAGALHVLCDEQERLLDAGHALTVVCNRPELLSVLRLVELEAVIEIVEDRHRALARLPSPPARRPSDHLAAWLAAHPATPA